jgi:hypothetical protein
MQVQYCDPPVEEAKKEEKKVENTCKGKKAAEKCNPCKAESDSKNGQDTKEEECTGKDAKNKDLCQWEKGKGCFPKSCKHNDWDCYSEYPILSTPEFLFISYLQLRPLDDHHPIDRIICVRHKLTRFVCSVTAFDSESKKAQNIRLADRHFYCGLYDYGAFR